MTTTAFSAIPTTDAAGVPITNHPSRTGRRMWALGAAAGVVSSFVVMGFVAIAEAAGVPMEVAENAAKQPEHIPLLGYATVILGSTLVGLLLATAFARWTPRPKLTFGIVALALTAFSFAFPATTTATTATKVILEVTHVIPAALIIPVIAAHLTSRRGRRTVTA